MLGVWGFARADAYFHQKADIESFEATLFAMQEISYASSGSVKPAALSDEDLLREPDPDFALWNKKRIDDYKVSLNHEFDLPEGLLEIPSIGLKVAVLYGTDDLTLNRGVGMIVGMSFPEEGGNVGIAGHRDGFFRGLKDVKTGEKIKMTTLSGVYNYEISSIDIVSKEEADALDVNDREKLTLVTCYPFYFVGHAPKRYVVQASLQNVTEL